MNDDLQRRDDPREPARRPPWRRIPARYSGAVYGGWAAVWITAFAMHQPEIGLPLMLGTGVLAAFVEPGRRGRRGYRRPGWGGPGFGGPWGGPPLEDPRGTQHDDVVPKPIPETAPKPAPAPQPAPPSPERRLAATVVRAESSGSAIDPDALTLIREVATLLRPLLAEMRGRDADPGVRHDVEAIATEHLPATLDAYLALPTDYAHDHRTADGTTPADEFRSQLTLLVEGCTQLRDALRAEDVSRQQQLGRFLQSKFARSDLDL